MGGITGDGRRCPGVGRLSAPTGHSAPCVGADEIIGPLAGLANGCCFLCYRPLAGLCRAGDLARRMGFAALQGFRDDASIVPYETQGTAGVYRKRPSKESLLRFLWGPLFVLPRCLRAGGFVMVYLAKPRRF